VGILKCLSNHNKENFSIDQGFNEKKCMREEIVVVRDVAGG
jgi:hypothetical protein